MKINKLIILISILLSVVNVKAYDKIYYYDENNSVSYLENYYYNENITKDGTYIYDKQTNIYINLNNISGNIQIIILDDSNVSVESYNSINSKGSIIFTSGSKTKNIKNNGNLTIKQNRIEYHNIIINKGNIYLPSGIISYESLIVNNGNIYSDSYESGLWISNGITINNGQIIINYYNYLGHPIIRGDIKINNGFLKLAHNAFLEITLNKIITSPNIYMLASENKDFTNLVKYESNKLNTYHSIIIESKKEIKVNDIKIQNKYYDGNTSAVIESYNITGILQDDDIQIESEANFLDSDIGNNKDVLIKFSILGNDSYKYQKIDDYISYADILENTVSHEEKQTNETNKTNENIMDLEQENDNNESEILIKNEDKTFINIPNTKKDTIFKYLIIMMLSIINILIIIVKFKKL